MEDTFKLRVDKIFGSLSSSSPSVSSPDYSSLWCLTDDEIEKKEWSRDKGSPEPLSIPKPSASSSKFTRISDEIEEIEALDDDDDKDGDVSGAVKESVKPEDHDDEEWQIRSSVGLDSTLDSEDEEDEYDKVAVGREKVGDPIFMAKVNDNGTCSTNCYNKHPMAFNQAVKDSRANLVAAKLRLEEADGSANDNKITDISDLKSIMKRKEKDLDLELQKRVRFDYECKVADADLIETCPMDNSQASIETFVVTQDNALVPDYIRNPSKYTCYSFDSSNEVDEATNQRAYLDFLNSVKKSSAMDEELDEASVDLPKSVTFIPRKKAGEVITVKNGFLHNQNEQDAGTDSAQRKGVTVSIAVDDEVEESEVCDMDEDEPETMADNSSSSKTSARHYRSKNRA